jgi:AcrR family transcriptional regulator
MPEEKRQNENEGSLYGRLIKAGIYELNRYGVQNFSVRRIAGRCGVSCAAPYKHFKDKHKFIAAIIEYINDIWAGRQREVLARVSVEPTRRKILAICEEYIRFLVENPYFRSILMMTNKDFDSEYVRLRGQLSRISRNLVDRYCDEVGMPEKKKLVKTFIVRSLLYGAALMFDNGELEYDGENMAAVIEAIDREFDLP